MREVIRAGAKGYLSKSDAAKDLVSAVESLEQNRSYFNSRVGQMVLNSFMDNGKREMDSLPILTVREREILQLIAEGKSTKEVAVMLHVSVKTAETHRGNIMRKLDLHSTRALVLYAVRNNIVQIPASCAVIAEARSDSVENTPASAS